MFANINSFILLFTFRYYFWHLLVLTMQKNDKSKNLWQVFLFTRFYFLIPTYLKKTEGSSSRQTHHHHHHPHCQFSIIFFYVANTPLLLSLYVYQIKNNNHQRFKCKRVHQQDLAGGYALASSSSSSFSTDRARRDNVDTADASSTSEQQLSI